MTNKLTIEDIKKALDLIKEEKYEEGTIYEDEFQKIWGRFGVPTKIQLKKKGIKVLDEMIEDGRAQIDKNKKLGIVTTFMGVPIFVESPDKKGGK